MKPLFKHQKQDVAFYLKQFDKGEGVINLNPPGLGKTREAIESIRYTAKHGKTLVFAPKSILYPAWGNDFNKFAPELKYSIAYAHNRHQAFLEPADVYITNHDAAGWLRENPGYLEGVVRMDVDESTAYKNNTSNRSKDAVVLSKIIPIVNIMSGTFIPQSVTDAWNQAFLVDGGQRLGKSFYKFRYQHCEQKETFRGQKYWVDKPQAALEVATLLSDITIRHKREDCIDIPPNHMFTVSFKMNDTHRNYYEELERTCVLALDSEDVTAINKAALTIKLLQVASGAVYTSKEKYKVLDENRYELVTDMAEARDQCVIAFNWRHQKDLLVKHAKKRKIPYAIIDGTTPIKQREQYVADFQKGLYKNFYIHPQSGSHGLTLTAGTTTIWASPTDRSNAEHFEQFNLRIDRIGQTKPTETILICAEGTKDERAYELLNNKLARMSAYQNFSQLFTQ